MRSIGIIGVLLAMVIALVLAGKRLSAPVLTTEQSEQFRDVGDAPPKKITDLTDVARERGEKLEQRARNLDLELRE